MKATIRSIPAVSCRIASVLREVPQAGLCQMVVEYLKHPYAADKLRKLFAAAGLAARDALRLRGTDAEQRGLTDADEDAIIAAMTANPAYVERPIVETDKGVRLCRPQDRVHEIL